MAVVAASSKGARQAAVAGAASGLLTFGLYLPGASRAFGYDAGTTVGHFIATPSVFDPFRRQVVYNNHVFFSFLEHLVYSVTGSTSEVVLRLVPIAAGAVAVGLLAGAITRRWGVVPGLAAATILATNPVFVETARDVRGYSLLVLCTIGASLLFARAMATDSPSVKAAYAAVLAVGIATHLYMVFVLVAQVAVAVCRRRARTLRVAWYAGLLGGLVAYVDIAWFMIGHGETARGFQPGLPRQIVWELLGRNPVGVACAAALLAVGLWVHRRRPDVWTALAVVVLEFLGLWLVLQPLDFFARFFVWVVPGMAFLAAAAVRHRRWMGAPVAIAAVAGVVQVLPAYTADGGGYRAAAEVIDAVADRGGRPCAIGINSYPMLAYTRRYEVVTRMEQVDGCDVLAWVSPSIDARFARKASVHFPVSRQIAGGRLYCRTAAACGMAVTR
jgi:uncharacterized membrane protein